MTVAALAEVVQPALREGWAAAGLVCFGWDDICAYVAAAEAEAAPVILQAGPGARAHRPLPVMAKMMRHLAERALVPVVLHLDHGTSADECRAALDEGFSSVMFDGSRLPLAENIRLTAEIAAMAHAAGASCEGEIGFVGYASGQGSAGTDPAEAALFAAETGVDAMAVSVGNVHLQQTVGGGLDEALIAEISARTAVPLVIHGGSGVPVAQRRKLALSSNVCKFNIGTELRMTYGAALRQALHDPAVFDPLEIARALHDPLRDRAQEIIRHLRR